MYYKIIYFIGKIKDFFSKYLFLRKNHRDIEIIPFPIYNTIKVISQKINIYQAVLKRYADFTSRKSAVTYRNARRTNHVNGEQFLKIAASIDQRQFEENGQFTENSKQMFQNYANDYFAAMEEIKPSIHAGICGIKGRINEKLQEHSVKAYDAILTICNTEEYHKVALYDYELKCFQTAVRIYQKELNHDNCIFDGLEYTEHFQEIYQQMVMYFRRIQLRLAKPLQLEGMRYIREKNLSIYAVVQLLLDCEIGSKEEIAINLSEYYFEQNMVNEAVFLLSVVAENGRPEWQERLSQKKVELI